MRRLVGSVLRQQLGLLPDSSVDMQSSEQPAPRPIPQGRPAQSSENCTFASLVASALPLQLQHSCSFSVLLLSFLLPSEGPRSNF